MDRDERNDLTPTAGDPDCRAAAPPDLPVERRPDPPPLCSSPASPTPLLFRDFACLTPCSRREALRLMAGIALLPTAAAAASDAPSDDDGRRRRLETRLAADPRLDQKLSLAAWAEPLEELLARMSRESGVALAFEGPDTGDQRVNVVLKEQPLRRVMVLLAEALDLYWQRDRTAPAFRYVLFQDMQSRKREQEFLARARERYEEGIRRNIEALKLPPSEVEELRARNPVLARRLTEPDTRKALELIGQVPPRYWEPLMLTGRVEIPYADLAPREQEVVREYAEAKRKLHAERDLKPGTPRRRPLGDITQPGGQIVIHLFDGGHPTPFCEACVDLIPADGTIAYNFFGPAYTPEEQRQLREQFLPPRFGEQGAPADPGPPVTATWKARERLPWEDVLKAVVDGADLQVISDSYLYYWHESHDQLPSGAAVRDRPIAEVLNQVAPPFFYEWRRDGDVYLFRHRNWFQERRHNIPERDLRRWRGHLETGGRLRLEDLVEMALLTESQFRLLYHTPIRYGPAGKSREVLRLYAALSRFQRAQLETTGLRARDLKARQLELLRAWKPAAGQNADSWLRLRREPEAVVFILATGAPVPQEERVPLERGRTPSAD